MENRRRRPRGSTGNEGDLPRRNHILGGGYNRRAERYSDHEKPYDSIRRRRREVPIRSHPPAASVWETHTSNIIQLGKQIAIVDYSEVFERISSIMMIWILEDSETGVWTEKRFPLPQNWERYFPELLPFLVTSVDDGKITLIPRSLFRNWYVVRCNLKEKSTMKKAVYGLIQDDDWDSSYPPFHCDLSVCAESFVCLKELCKFQSLDSGFS